MPPRLLLSRELIMASFSSAFRSLSRFRFRSARSRIREHLHRQLTSCELLEAKLCLNATYDFQVLTRTGDALGLTAIEDSVSINDAGNVAFVASDFSGHGIYIDGSEGLHEVA